MALRVRRPLRWFVSGLGWPLRRHGLPRTPDRRWGGAGPVPGQRDPSAPDARSFAGAAGLALFPVSGLVPPAGHSWPPGGGLGHPRGDPIVPGPRGQAFRVPAGGIKPGAVPALDHVFGKQPLGARRGACPASVASIVPGLRVGRPGGLGPAKRPAGAEFSSAPAREVPTLGAQRIVDRAGPADSKPQEHRDPYREAALSRIVNGDTSTPMVLDADDRRWAEAKHVELFYAFCSDSK